ncbi:hypothetical protein TNCT_223671 [Trichonephila clavata]|uniref:Uncharacterized protein n=1 Tax=Trichonephila clavata TaxID=2740835 RepID=A0A8X6G9T3_TRICU|nr:hypothetical protein TNCT_223671 [Trichonephila clavata]
MLDESQKVVWSDQSIVPLYDVDARVHVGSHKQQQAIDRGCHITTISVVKCRHLVTEYVFFVDEREKKMAPGLASHSRNFTSRNLDELEFRNIYGHQLSKWGVLSVTRTRTCKSPDINPITSS